jgi:hypothetical protein
VSARPSTIPRGVIDEDGDWVVRQFVAPADLERTPEEYVARHAHALGGFSFHLYHFNNPALGAWVRRVGDLIASDEMVEQCRQQYLSQAEADVARQQSIEEL